MRFLLALPVFNEEAFLPRVIERVRHFASDILVVDDGSTDATPSLLCNLGPLTVLRHPKNCGYGQSLIDAFAFAAGRDYEWIITMDCDDQHEPAHIPEFVSAAARDETDIISGSRYLLSMQGNDSPPPDRRRINSTVTWILNDILGLNLTDAFCGFKACRVSAIQRLALDVPGYAFPLQFWVQAAYHNLRISELPVKLIYNDPNRHFGGALDEPDSRLRHYLDVMNRELDQVGWPALSDRSHRPEPTCPEI
jgi:glycosyltransferase involved in cell wall biosynthesis